MLHANIYSSKLSSAWGAAVSRSPPETEEEQPVSAKSGRSRPARGAASRSRRLMGRLARSLSKSQSPASEDESEGDEEEVGGAGVGCRPPELPTWKGCRIRSGLRRGRSDSARQVNLKTHMDPPRKMMQILSLVSAAASVALGMCLERLDVLLSLLSPFN